jgi:Cd2+/Zn2+-exporting ATPase
MTEQTYKIKGMDCADCARTVEKGVSGLAGARRVEVDFATATLRLDGDVTLDTLQERLQALGYRIETPADAPAPVAPPGGVTGFVRFLLAERASRFALVGGALIVLGVIASVVGLDGQIARLIYVAATLIALYPVARSGINNLLLNRDFNINLLMTIAAVGALVMDETLEAATVVFLFAIGEALEGYTADRARQSIRSLMTLVPPTAIRLRNGREETVPVQQLAVGDTILVRAGDRLSMDGAIAAGESSIDQSPVTGESVPVYRTIGAEVYAGTINLTGALEIRVTRLAADNTIQRIIRMVEEAHSVRAPSQRLVDRFARVYTPAVVALAAGVALVPPLLFSQPFYNTPDGAHGWLYRALTLLVIACPCALVISTPVTVISAITRAARRGVLIKGGAHLETLGRVRAVAFDKTGTLTRGKPVVTGVRSADCVTGESCALCDDVLALATALERRSAHPLARAVVEAAAQRGLDAVYVPAESVETLAGRGVQGDVNGKRVIIGSHGWFDAEHPHPAAFCDLAHEAEARGETTMLLREGEQIRGYIAVADEIRPESASVLAQLRALGQRTVMLTGDHDAVARAVAGRVGVDDVQSELLPDDKVAAVAALCESYGAVEMVGEGFI